MLLKKRKVENTSVALMLGKFTNALEQPSGASYTQTFRVTNLVKLLKLYTIPTANTF